MCEPATLTAMTAAITSAATTAAPYLAATSAVLGYAQQSEAASAQADAIKKNMEFQQNQLQLQRTQNDQQASEKMSAVALEALKQTGHLRAMQGDSLMVGNSTDRIENEMNMNAGSDMATLEANRLSADNQVTTEAMAAKMRADNQMSSIKMPSLIGTGLQIAGGFVDKKARDIKNTPVTPLQ